MDFKNCKNILIIRPDNMGDLLMSVPAIRAIKTSFGCKITVLCSSKAVEIAAVIEEVDDKIVFDLPWLKFDSLTYPNINGLVDLLKEHKFDGCILFNVYSQNPAPCLMLAYLAGIKNRAAYSRENLYGLLTHWLPDDEPLQRIRHQVERDLNLARFLGATVLDDRIHIVEQGLTEQLSVLKSHGLLHGGYFVLHTGVSEKKRQYPQRNWVTLAHMLIKTYHMPLMLTGTKNESNFTEELVKEIGGGCNSLAGKLSLKDLTILIKHARCMISVNTGPMHLAVALEPPLIALYAQTNPQHIPFKTKYKILEYSVPKASQSLNQIICWVNEKLYHKHLPYPSPEQIMKQLADLIDEIGVSSPPALKDKNQDILSNR